MPTPDDERRCECGHPQSWTADPRVPITFDERLNEYWLTSTADGVQTIMRYCFWCGGRLPESKRDELFFKMDPAEFEEAQKVTAEVRSVEDAFRILGRPDQEFEGHGGFRPKGGEYVSFKRTLRYMNRWATLYLDVYELPYGSIARSYRRKYKGEGPCDS